MRMFLRSLAFGVVVVILQGCGCMAQVAVTNNTPLQMLADISLPDPGDGVLRRHCQFTVLLEPGQTWDSRQATRRDIVELPVGPHENVLLRLMNLDAQGWPARAFSIGVVETGKVMIAGDWDALRVTAEDSLGNDLQVWLDDMQRWSPLRRRSSEDENAPILPRR